MAESTLIPYRKKTKWGYCNFDKEILIPCQFDGAEPFFEDRAVVFMDKETPGCLGVIDERGNLICEVKYEMMNHFKNGFAAVSKNGKWGFINKEGKEQISLIYDNVLDFSEGRAAIKLNGKFGFIDSEGYPITECNYENCDSFHNGYASVMEEGKHGAIDIHGKEVVPCISSIPVEFSEGLAAISLINPDAPLNLTAQRFKNFDIQSLIGHEKDGEIIFEDGSGNVYDKESIELASKNHRCGYVNAERQTVIGFDYDMALPFSEGIACVAIGGKYGFIDKTAAWVTKPDYEDARDFKEGLARVRKDGKWGYINKRGEVVIDFLYEDAEDFNEGYAKVVRTDPERNQGHRMIGLIDAKGEEIFYPSYCDDSEDEKDWTYAEVYHSEVRNGFIAFRDLDGTFFIHDTYTGDDMHLPEQCIDVFPFKNGIAKVKLRYGLKKVLPGYIGENWEMFWEDF